MASLQLNDASAFARCLVEHYCEPGFQALSKRDLDLLLFVLLEKDGVISREMSNFAVARLLKLTPSRVRTLRREGYARWRELVQEERAAVMMRILQKVLTEANLAAASAHATEKTRADGFLAIRIEHPSDKEEFEQAILDAGGIPVYERNRDVLAVRFDTLLAISEEFGFADKDPVRVRRGLKQLAPAAEELEDVLKKNVKDLTWQDARTALSALGVSVVKNAAEDKVSGLLKIVFPFL